MTKAACPQPHGHGGPSCQLCCDHNAGRGHGDTRHVPCDAATNPGMYRGIPRLCRGCQVAVGWWPPPDYLCPRCLAVSREAGE